MQHAGEEAKRVDEGDGAPGEAREVRGGEDGIVAEDLTRGIEGRGRVSTGW